MSNNNSSSMNGSISGNVSHNSSVSNTSAGLTSNNNNNNNNNSSSISSSNSNSNNNNNGNGASGSSSSGSSNVQKKLVVVGDPSVGKTSLLTVFKSGVFPTAYEPTVFENSVKDLVVDGKRIELLLWDTAGQEGMDRVRVMSYNKADAILICYAIDSQSSFENIHHKWIKEVSKHCRESRIFLVGMKTDLRDKSQVQLLSKVDGEGLVSKLELTGYMECSSKENKGVQEIFENVTRILLTEEEPKKKNCIVM